MYLQSHNSSADPQSTPCLS